MSMPRTIDRRERHHALGRAVWRVIVRDGLDHASVRNVAAEAGLSTGSLRHSFGSHSELLGFALELVGDRIERRIVGVDRSAGPQVFVPAMIEEMLPLDDERRAECTVWIAFAVRSLTDQHLAEQRALTNRRLEQAFGSMVDHLAGAGLLGAGRDPALEAERLSALVDGLIVHGLLATTDDAGRMSRAVVRAHLADLATPPAATP